MSSLGRLVASTDFFPLRPLYAAIYRGGLQLLKSQLQRLPGLCAVYLTGSYAQGQHVHGRSDIDFFVVLERDHPGRPVKSALERCAALFPFLGPVSERLHQVVVLDPRQEVDNPHLLYRARAGLLRPLFERPGFRLRGSIPAGALDLSEACLQTRLALEGVRRGQDDLYFWKSRLGALARVLELNGGRWEADPRLRQPAARLLGQPGDQGCLEALAELLEALDRRFPASPSASLPLANLPGTGAVEELRFTQAALRTARGPWRLELPGFTAACADPRWDDFRRDGSLFSWRPLSLAGFGEGLLVASRAEGPGGPLWSWTLEQARRTLAYLSTQLDERRLLESDWGLLQLVLGIVTLQALPHTPSRAELLAQLRSARPEHGDFLGQLQEYLTGLEEGRGLAASRPLAANFFGYLREFARGLLEQGPFPSPASLDRSLSLSLCVVTRDRVDWLAQLLASVRVQTRQPDEIVVVDNSPTASARSLCEAQGVRYFHHPEGRLGNVRNRAVQESRGEILAFTDDDCLLEPQWLAHVERSFLRDERIGVVGGPVRHHCERSTAVDHFHRAYLG